MVGEVQGDLFGKLGGIWLVGGAGVTWLSNGRIKHNKRGSGLNDHHGQKTVMVVISPLNKLIMKALINILVLIFYARLYKYIVKSFNLSFFTTKPLFHLLTTLLFTLLLYNSVFNGLEHNLYEQMGLTRTASQEQIMRVRPWHREYDILKSPGGRLMYDQFGETDPRTTYNFLDSNYLMGKTMECMTTLIITLGLMVVLYRSSLRVEFMFNLLFLNFLLTFMLNETAASRLNKPETVPVSVYLLKKAFSQMFFYVSTYSSLYNDLFTEEDGQSDIIALRRLQQRIMRKIKPFVQSFVLDIGKIEIVYKEAYQEQGLGWVRLEIENICLAESAVGNLIQIVQPKNIQLKPFLKPMITQRQPILIEQQQLTF